MEIGFFAREWDVQPGRHEQLRFGLLNNTDTALDCSYRLESEDQRFDPAWCVVRAASWLPPQAHVEGVIEVQVPSSGGPPVGSYRLRVVALDRIAGSSAAAVCTLRIAHRSSLRFDAAPSVTLNPDGSLTANVRIGNGGNLSLTGSIRIRHGQGWQFFLDQPQFTIRPGGDWVTVRLTPPPGQQPSGAEDVVVELMSDGTVTAHADVKIDPGAPSFAQSGSKPPASGRLRNLAVKATVTATATVSLTGVVQLLRGPPEPPQPEPVNAIETPAAAELPTETPLPPPPPQPPPVIVPPPPPSPRPTPSPPPERPTPEPSDDDDEDDDHEDGCDPEDCPPPRCEETGTCPSCEETGTCPSCEETGTCSIPSCEDHGCEDEDGSDSDGTDEDGTDEDGTDSGESV